MNRKRIETNTSRTAQMTCISRAISSLERSPCYRSADNLALRLLPGFFQVMAHSSLFRSLFRRVIAPAGVYEYVIARTKYMDTAFRQALDEDFDQVLLFGAGFDTRALRLQDGADQTRIFELDSQLTQQAKLQQYRKRGLSIPHNVTFIAIDFDKELLSTKLDDAGFRKGQKSLFIMEGLLMYLEPESVRATFQVIQMYAGANSRVVFDYIQVSVLRDENRLYGEARLKRFASNADERWQFGLDPGDIPAFLKQFGLVTRGHTSAPELEEMYFRDEEGQLVGRINGTHCLVTAESTSTT